jgi:hypothetical protein
MNCFYCERPTVEVPHRPYNPLQRTRDHTIPRCRGAGGKIVVCCRECNQFKGDLTIEEFELATNIMHLAGFRLERTYGRARPGCLKALTHHATWPRIKAVMGPAYKGRR